MLSFVTSFSTNCLSVSLSSARGKRRGEGRLLWPCSQSHTTAISTALSQRIYSSWCWCLFGCFNCPAFWHSLSQWPVPTAHWKLCRVIRGLYWLKIEEFSLEKQCWKTGYIYLICTPTSALVKEHSSYLRVRERKLKTTLSWCQAWILTLSSICQRV